MKKIILYLSIIMTLQLHAQSFLPKSHTPEKLKKSPKIDGVIDELCWNDLETLTQFIQFYPECGKDPKFDTEVKIYYTNNAIFIAAQLFDPNPDSINIELGARDSDQNANADLFAVHLMPYNDGVNAFQFTVSASGVQTDISFSGNNEDSN